MRLQCRFTHVRIATLVLTTAAGVETTLKKVQARGQLVWG
jgi:hypothetical protein